MTSPVSLVTDSIHMGPPPSRVVGERSLLALWPCTQQLMHAVCIGAGRDPMTWRRTSQHGNYSACETPLQGPPHTCKLRPVLSCTACCCPGREACPSQLRSSQRAVAASARLLWGEPGPSPGLSLGWRGRLLQHQSALEGRLSPPWDQGTPQALASPSLVVPFTFPRRCTHIWGVLLNKSGFPGGSAGKESACKAGDPSSIPGSGRSPGEGKGCPLQYSGLENSMDCMAYGVTS